MWKKLFWNGIKIKDAFFKHVESIREEMSGSPDICEIYTLSRKRRLDCVIDNNTGHTK